jgi:uncharacterized membrane protein
VNVETIVYTLILVLAILLVAWRLGARPGLWRETVLATLLYVAVSLSLMAVGVGSTESITIAVIGPALLIAAWKRLARRRSEGSV